APHSRSSAARSPFRRPAELRRRARRHRQRRTGSWRVPRGKRVYFSIAALLGKCEVELQLSRIEMIARQIWIASQERLPSALAPEALLRGFLRAGRIIAPRHY